MVTWLFLTAGVFLGMHWAYAVLGWGGYWSWDPVENASLMPWLTGTAFLHSVMMQEKKGMMKSLNVWLIFFTFLLTLLGTMLTRGGLVSSVHAFAKSSIGDWFMIFMVMVLAACVFTYILQGDHLKSELRLESLVSRESSFMFANLVLFAGCVVIVLGTLTPILSEYFAGAKVTLGPDWYNRVAVPIGLFLLLLMGVGPLLPWRSTSFKNIRRNFVLPVIALWVVVIGCLIAGVRPWHDGTLDQGSFYALVAFGLSAGVLTAICSEFLRGMMVIARQSGRNIFWATYQLIRRNTRRYGGYMVHIGVVIVVIGLAGSAFNRTQESADGGMALHDKLDIGPYTLEYAGPTQDTNPNYDSEYAILNVSKGDQPAKMLEFDGFMFHVFPIFHIVPLQMTPGKRVYMASQQPQTMVAIHSVVAWDLYVVYDRQNPETGQPIIKAFLNPLVSWIWAGVLLMVLGTLVALTPRQWTVNSGQ
jgi:cytochrome c-type biogenesis protein CcmF